MAEYKNYDDSVLTSIQAGWNGRDIYLQQAREDLKKTGTFTPLPLSKDFDGNFSWSIFGESGWNKERDEIARDSQIMAGVLQESFKSDDPEYLSKLLTTYGRYHSDIQETQKQAFFHETIRDISAKKFYENPHWANKLSAEAKLAILAINGDNHTFLQNISKNPEFMDIKLPEGVHHSNFATLLAEKIYTPKRTQPHYTEYVPWEIKAVALKYDHSSNSKVNRINMLQDLMENSHNNGLDRNATIKTLTEILEAHSWQRQDSSSRELNSEFKNYFYKNAQHLPACEETGKLFTTLMTTYQMFPQSFDINFNSLNYPAFQEATEKRNALDNLASMKKNFADKKMSARDLQKYSISTIAKHHPEFFEVNWKNKFEPSALKYLVTDSDVKLSKQTALKMMTHLVKETSNSNLTDFNLYIDDLPPLIDKAASLNSASKENQEFIDAVQAKLNSPQEQNRLKKDMEEVKRAKQLKQQKQHADAEYKKYTAAQDMFNTIMETRLKVSAHPLNNTNEPLFSEQMINDALKAALNGNITPLQYTPSSGLKKLFTSKDKQANEQDLMQKVGQFNRMLESITLSTDKDAVEVLKTLKGPLIPDTYREEFYPQYREASQATNIDIPDVRYMESYIKNHQEAQDTLSAYQAIYAERKSTAIGRARTDLSMKFNQEFDGKPLPGLVEEGRRAGEIYKTKAEKLRSKIKDEVKEDMERRGVNKKPEISKSDNSGKPMDEQSKKVANLIKEQKLYQNLADKHSNSNSK